MLKMNGPVPPVMVVSGEPSMSSCTLAMLLPLLATAFALMGWAGYSRLFHQLEW